jgi:hypothetical protein
MLPRPSASTTSAGSAPVTFVTDLRIAATSSGEFMNSMRHNLAGITVSLRGGRRNGARFTH